MTATDEQILNAEALRRYDEARALVEHAQHTLEKAASTLASVSYGAPACERIGKQAQRAHDLWRWLSYVFRPKHVTKMTLDGNNEGPFLEFLKQYPDERLLLQASFENLRAPR